MTRHSVILSCYNGQAYIAAAIESVLSQIKKYDELIVVDDASTDNTRLCVEAFNDPRIRLICRHQNGGPAQGRNEGLKIFKGEYLSFIDHDDLWGEGRIDDIERVIHSMPDVQVIYGQVAHFLDNKALETSYKVPATQRSLLLGSVTLARDLVKRVGLLDTNLTCGEFVDYMARARQMTEQWYGSEVVYLKRRIHGKNYTLTHAKDSTGYLSVVRAHLLRKQGKSHE